MSEDLDLVAERLLDSLNSVSRAPDEGRGDAQAATTDPMRTWITIREAVRELTQTRDLRNWLIERTLDVEHPERFIQWLLALNVPSEDAYWRSLLLGVCCMQFRNVRAAGEHLIDAAERSTDPREMLQLIGALRESRQWAALDSTASKLLALSPESLAAREALAVAAANQGQLERAVQLWREVIERSENPSDAWGHLGNTYFAARKPDSAAACYREVIAAHPGDIAAHLNLFAALRDLGQDAEAEAALTDALQVESVTDSEFEMIVAGFIQKGDDATLARILERWLELSPGNSMALHFLNAVQSARPDETGRTASNRGPGESAKYVQQLFDRFAQSYDSQLDLLEYQGPTVLAEFLDRLPPAARGGRVLDLGCGTGLCGDPLGAFGNELWGVDLSREMLERARQKGHYDELEHAEISEFLSRSNARFRLICSFDTLVYVGDLDPVFRAVAASLEPEGHFLFCVECLADEADDEDFVLALNGRYQHSLAYLQKTLAESALTAHTIERRVLRLEGARPVYHMVVHASRPADKGGDASLPPTLRDGGATDEARIFERVVQSHPQLGYAHFSLGNAYLTLGRFAEARSAFQAAADRDNDAASWNNLGNAEALLGELEAAALSFAAALERDPDFVPALNNAGRAAFQRGRASEAHQHLNRALALDPENARALLFLGNIFAAQGEPDRALECYERSVAINPRQPDCLFQLGNAYRAKHRLSDAAASFVRAQQLDPQNPYIYNNLGEINRQRGQITESAFCLLQARQLAPREHAIHSNLLLTMLYDETVESWQIRAEAEEWAARFATPLPKFARSDNQSTGHRRLKVGYVSPDLRDHPVGLLLAPVLKHHDRERFEIFCYACHDFTDPVAQTLRERSDHWIAAAHWNDEQLAARIAEDGIDLLVDLAGHTGHHRLRAFARKPAPVQLSWIGYPATTGMKEMDYIVADRQVIPAAERELYTEEPLYLESGLLCYEPPAAPPVTGLPATSSGTMTFGCFNNIAKLSPSTLWTWSQILLAVPQSRLFLKSPALSDSGVVRRLQQLLRDYGVPEERLHFEGGAPRSELLAAYGQVDIGLDPFPYGGGITSLEALWMGVPVVTLQGNRYASNVTPSLMRRLALDSFVADSRSRYVEIATEWAQQRARLAEIRNGLRERLETSPICDAPAFTLQLETAFRRAWGETCQATSGIPG